MSINANGGNRIKISPTTSGVSALPPTVSLFYQITESLTDATPGSDGASATYTGRWNGSSFFNKITSVGGDLLQSLAGDGGSNNKLYATPGNANGLRLTPMNQYDPLLTTSFRIEVEYRGNVVTADSRVIYTQSSQDASTTDLIRFYYQDPTQSIDVTTLTESDGSPLAVDSVVNITITEVAYEDLPENGGGNEDGGGTPTTDLTDPTTYTQLQLLVYNASEDGSTVIDLGGRTISPDKPYADYQQYGTEYVDPESFLAYPRNNALKSDVTVKIKNGTISGGFSPNNWETMGGGVFRAPLDQDDLLAYPDSRLYMADPGQTADPLCATHGRGDDQSINYTYRFVDNSSWYRIDDDMLEAQDTVPGPIKVWVNVEGVETDYWEEGVQNSDENYPLLGWTFDDAGKAEFEAYATTCGGAENVILFVHSDANVMASFKVQTYDPASGKLIFRTPEEASSFNYSQNYLDATYTGTHTDLEEGEYNIAWDDTVTGVTAPRYMYYRPLNGDPATALIPRITNTFMRQTGAGNQVTFENIAFNSFGEGGDATSAVLTGESVPHSQTMQQYYLTECDVSHCASFTSGVTIKAEDSTFRRFVTRGMACQDGSDIQRCVLQDSDTQSMLNIQCPTTTDGEIDGTVTPRKTIVKDNLISLPVTTHGNAVALYKATWMNAEIEHNLFFNCKNTIVFQAGPDKDSYNKPWTNTGEVEPKYWFTFRQNLAAYVYDSTGVTGNQSGFTWNSGDKIKWNSTFGGDFRPQPWDSRKTDYETAWRPGPDDIDPETGSAFDSDDWEPLRDSQPGARVLIEHNTMFWDSSIIDENDPTGGDSIAKSVKGMWLGVSGFGNTGDGSANNSDTKAYLTGPAHYVHIRGNFMPGCNTIDQTQESIDNEDDVLGRVYQQNNYFTLSSDDAGGKFANGSQGLTDFVPENTDTKFQSVLAAFSPTDLTIQNPTTISENANPLTFAPDEGAVGHRWASTPSKATVIGYLESGTYDWAANHQMLATPDYPLPVEGEDGPMREGLRITSP